MAQEIVTWCDIHLDQGNSVKGQTWTFSVSEPGGKPRTFELDACGECGGMLSGVFGSIAEHARQIAGSKREAPRALSSGGVSASNGAVPASNGAVTCPLCDATPVSVGALETHLRNHHQTSIAEQNGTATIPCPVSGCSRKAKGQTGLMAHIRMTHVDYYAEHRDSLLASA